MARLMKILGLLGFASLPVPIRACTYVEIPFPAAKDATTHLVARSMELGNDYHAMSYIIEVVPAGANGGKYGYVSPTSIANLQGAPEVKAVMEGMNEKGLTISALVLNEAVYEPEKQAGKEDVSYLDVTSNVLANCSSVDSALRYLETVSVVRSLFRKGVPKFVGKALPTLHWAITDSTGRSVVVEYLRGKRIVFENHPRVLTNDPNIEWMWRNLNNYVNLSPEFPDQNQVIAVDTENPAIGTVPRAVSHGWNLLGLPGDFSPVSRFVRMFYLRGYALRASPPKSLSDAIVLGTALLNNVFIPFGTVARDKKVAGDEDEITPYAVLKSAEKKVMLIRAYRNTQWRKIDLARLNFAKAQTWPLEDGELGVLDITESGSSSRRLSSEPIMV